MHPRIGFVFAAIVLVASGCDRPKAKANAEPAATPSASSSAAPNAAAPMLRVFLVATGISIKGAGGNVATGCENTGSGLAVPNKSGEYDFAELQRCVEKLKATVPGLADQGSITIVADKGVVYGNVIKAMDAVRRTHDGKDLFPNVVFDLPVKDAG